MRLGAMLKPQAQREMTGPRTCALGAALDAIGVEVVAHGEGYNALIWNWPILRMEVATPPALLAIDPRYPTTRLEAAIVLLNDAAGWTREAIADYVETLEQSQVVSEPVMEAVA